MRALRLVSENISSTSWITPRITGMVTYSLKYASAWTSPMSAERCLRRKRRGTATATSSSAARPAASSNQNSW